MWMPPSRVPIHMPYFMPGLTLRTFHRSLNDQEARKAAGYAASSSPPAAPAFSAVKAASAARMPLFMALWLHLMRGRLPTPAEQPKATKRRVEEKEWAVG